MLALGAAPAAAANVTGWYAGIYAGGASASDLNFAIDEYVSFLSGPGVIETPTSYVNDGGIDAGFFDFLTLGPEEYPFADLGLGAAYLSDGTLDLLASPTGGVVVGYGLGNGFRVEGDFSAASFVGGVFTTQSEVIQGASGMIDGSGVWTWTHAGEVALPLSPPVNLADVDLFYSYDVQFLLLSGYYDIDTGTAVTPYLGGGVGLARVTHTFEDDCLCVFFTQTRLAPAAQLGAGVKIAVGGPVSLDLGYRYKATQGADFDAVDVSFNGFGDSLGLALQTSGLVGIHTLQAGLTVALQ